MKFEFYKSLFTKKFKSQFLPFSNLKFLKFPRFKYNVFVQINNTKTKKGKKKP